MPAGTAQLRPHQRVRLDVLNLVTAAPAGLSPALWSERSGAYYKAYVKDNNVWVAYSSTGSPPYLHETPASSDGDCLEPAVCVDHRGMVVLLCVRTSGGPDVEERRSWDRGLTWSDPTVAFAGAIHPRVAKGHDGTLIRMAWLAGKIYVTRQAPGDPAESAPVAIKDAAGADILTEDDCFDIVKGHTKEDTWELSIWADGESAISDWFSTMTDASTWTRRS
jgi:hypothetical protein